MNSETVEAALRKAMHRLLDGQALHTDGDLTLTNLALEARVGRASLYRHKVVLAEWHIAIGRRPPSPLVPPEPQRSTERELRDALSALACRILLLQEEIKIRDEEIKKLRNRLSIRPEDS